MKPLHYKKKQKNETKKWCLKMSHSDVSSLLNLRKDLKLLMENQVH